MSLVLTVLLVLGTWLIVQEDLKAPQRHSFDDAAASMKVYAPINRHQRCRRIGAGPVFRDLNTPTD